ncbi:RNA-binding protein NOB1 [Podospora aff. communis PSN243]|uniref:20S-pre-rRNA D-site endonuclease NOB1 n=1 Tax=Podospora aff. communis PSN243 TaxID=3040156 RepID=A0AAV9GEW5_9PEZI|nr:RNA-binding protein NOB1 [Podospora aff. communis PSN243]
MEAPVSASEAPVSESQNPAPAIAPAPAPTESLAPASVKPVHSLVVDANAIIKNDPPVSTLLSQAEQLYTIPAVVSEIRDEAARSRFQTTLQPFITLRTPRPESVQFVTDFARRTGDLQVLSKPDLHLLALTYELELERNGGDWRLRKDPTQKRVNGKPPGRSDEGKAEKQRPETETVAAAEQAPGADDVNTTAEGATEPTAEEVVEAVQRLDIAADRGDESGNIVEVEAGSTSEEEVEDDGDGEWITPSNIKKHQARENTSSAPQPIQRVLQAALITADMAMRNVALRINLNLLDSGFSRITFLKTWVLRCHGCWHVCKDTTKQFCPKCGHDSLTRVSCTTDAAGNFTLHLKKNFQFNKRGNVFSIPKPTHGTANGRQSGVKGGGKNGWGNELILAEDQKEYIRKTEEDKRTRYRDLMDDDYLPGILTGARSSGPGRIKVGAGRNVNAKKKR